MAAPQQMPFPRQPTDLLLVSGAIQLWGVARVKATERVRKLLDTLRGVSSGKKAPKLVARMKPLINRKLYSDITCLVGKRKVPFPAHRVVLAARSPVFAHELFPHGKPTKAQTIVVDADPDIFELALENMYTDAAAVITAENVAGVLEFSMNYRVTSLRNACVKYINQRADEIIESPAFVSLSKDVLGAMLMRSDLNIREVALFKAVVRWGHHQCKARGMEDNTANVKELISELLPLIRFPIMDMQELLNEVQPTGLIEQDVLVDVITAQVTKTSHNRFSSQQRRYDGTANAERLRDWRKRQLYIELGIVSIIGWFLLPCLPALLMFLLLVVTSLPRFIPLGYFIRSIVHAAPAISNFLRTQAITWRNFLDLWFSTPAVREIAKKFGLVILSEFILDKLNWSNPYIYLVLRFIVIVLATIVRVGTIPFVIFVNAQATRYNRTLGQVWRENKLYPLLSLASPILVEVLFRYWASSPTTPVLSFLFYWIGIIALHLFRIIGMPWGILYNLLEWNRISRYNGYNAASHRNLALFFATLTGLTELAYWYWGVEFFLFLPFMRLVKYALRMAPFPFIIGGLAEIFLPPNRRNAGLFIGSMFCSALVEIFFSATKLETEYLEPFIGLWASLMYPILHFVLPLLVHAIRILPGAVALGMCVVYPALAWRDAMNDLRRMTPGGRVAFFLSVPAAVIVVELLYRRLGIQTTEYGNFLHTVLRLAANVLPGALYIAYKAALDQGRRDQRLRIGLATSLVTAGALEYYFWHTGAEAPLYSAIRGALGTLLRCVPFGIACWMGGIAALNYYRENYSATPSQPPPTYTLWPPFVQNTYAHDLFDWLRAHLTFRTSELHRWLKRLAMFIAGVEALQLVFPFQPSSLLPVPFYLPLSLALHVVRVVPVIMAVKGLYAQTTVPVSSPRPRFAPTPETLKWGAAAAAVEVVFRFVMPAPYRTFFGWFLHYVAFGWLRPFTICGALTSGLAACI